MLGQLAEKVKSSFLKVKTICGQTLRQAKRGFQLFELIRVGVQNPRSRGEVMG